MSIGNDASRVSVRKRGRPSFLVLLNARASNPGHSYLRLRRKCRPPSAPRVRLRTLNRTSYESKKRDDERAHRREGGEHIKEFQHLGTSDRVVGRPRTECVAKPFYCEHSHLQLVNAILTNICSIVTNTIHHPAEPGRIVRVCPTCLRFQNVPDRRGDSGYNINRKRRTPRKCLGARAA